MREAPDPSPRSGEVRVRVAAAGVNFADIRGRMGLNRDAPPRPYVPGYEVTGTVEAVGQGVTEFKEGDSVFGLTRFNGYSDVVCIPVKQLHRRLEWMSPEHAAAIPVNYLTAYYMLIVMGSLRRGDRVLNHNAGSGTGLAVLDICKIMGAEVYGTASPAKHPFLLERGLQHAINYRQFDYEQVVTELTAGQGVHIVLDPLGSLHWRKNYRLLMPTGRLICYGLSRAVGKRRSLLKLLELLLSIPFYSPLKLMGDNKAVIGINLARLWEQSSTQRSWMSQIVAWYDEALFRPHIDRTFKLSQAADAHRYIQDRKSTGKVLLLP